MAGVTTGSRLQSHCSGRGGVAGALRETVPRALKMRRPRGLGTNIPAAAQRGLPGSLRAPPSRGPGGAVATPGPPCRPDPPLLLRAAGPGSASRAGRVLFDLSVTRRERSSRHDHLARSLSLPHDSAAVPNRCRPETPRGLSSSRNGAGELRLPSRAQGGHSEIMPLCYTHKRAGCGTWAARSEPRRSSAFSVVALTFIVCVCVVRGELARVGSLPCRSQGRNSGQIVWHPLPTEPLHLLKAIVF